MRVRRETAAVEQARGSAAQPAPGAEAKTKRRRLRSSLGAGASRWRSGWPGWARTTLEAVALLAAGMVAVLAALGRLADWFAGASLWSHLLPFAGAVLALGIATALVLRGWLLARAWLGQRSSLLPVMLAVAIGGAAIWFATRPAFHREVTSLRGLVGGTVEAGRMAMAHQVFAAYRRSDLEEVLLVLERARVYEPTVHEAAAAFGVDAEVLIGVGATESSFYPRDSTDGGRGLFQITKPPNAAVADARRRLGVARLDPLNQRHNAFVAAATLRRYLDEMGGDLFLGLLAYNIGPRNGGLRAIMRQYGARDFVTIQPYLKHLPRDYPIRVLSAALAYRLWRAEGLLPRYQEGDNAMRIQRRGIPGLPPGPAPRLRAPAGS